jgi:branched-chain amino acid transport system substrate-binding protein
MVKGITLFMEQNHNSLAGRKIELIVENDESNPATGIAKVRKLIEQDKCTIIDGFLLANIGYAVAPLAEKYKVPMILAVAASDDLTQRRRSDWVLRTSNTSSQPQIPFGEWVYKKLGYKKVITVGMDYSFGWENVGGFQKSFEDAGGQVVQKIWAPLGFSDFTSFIKSMHKDADAVFLLSVGAAADVFPKQYKANGPGLPLIGGGTSFDETILHELGDEAIGAVSPLHYCATLDTQANKKFAREFRAKYKVEPSYYSEGAYVTGLWIKKALESLKGDVSDNNKLLAALKKVELKDAPRGPIKLDEFNNAVQNTYIRRVEKVNGKLQNKVIATFPNVSQFGKESPDQYMKQPSYSHDYPPCTHCAATK